MTTESFSRLAGLIEPVEIDKFLSDYWECAPLIINRQSAGFYGNLLSLDDVDCVLTSQRERHPGIRLARGETSPKLEDYATSAGRVDAIAASRLFVDGSTIILNGMQRRLPRLHALCTELEAETGVSFQTNLYLTPPGAEGFKTHYDTHDVFILQIEGTKDWELFESPINLPLPGQHHGSSNTTPGVLTAQFALNPGDLAYIPRGLYHCARAGGALSLHITLGALARRWVDLLLEAVAELALRDSSLRRSLPLGFGLPACDMAPVEAQFTKLLRHFVENADFSGAAESIAQQLASTREPVVRHHLVEMASINLLSCESVVVARKDPYRIVRETNDAIEIVHRGMLISLPRYTSTSVRSLLSGTPVRVADLSDDLDDEGKLVLVRRLVAEGVLSSARSGLAEE